VVSQLHYISDCISSDLSLNSKLEFLYDTRQSFGNTALVLQGGATFGLFHLGVVKALNESKLLPRIISGSSVGALIASLVCIHTEEELPDIFKENGIDLKAFSKKDAAGNIQRKLARFCKNGGYIHIFGLISKVFHVLIVFL
jgi:TAG lipase / lysophosphatidylethanolamine acyltransferase